jgi:hypothetical protein
MSGDEKKPGLLRRLFGFRSREVAEKTPVTPEPPQPPTSKPSRKNLSERQGRSKKDTQIPPAKTEAKLKGSPPAGPKQRRQAKSARKAAKKTAVPPNHGPIPAPRTSDEGRGPAELDAPVAQDGKTSGLLKTLKRIQFGMLDENAVRFTNDEAWWLVEGVWSQIPVAEVLDNAVVLSETRYDELFGDVLQLPSAAFQR